MTEKVDTPKWDEALANMALQEFRNQGRPLTMADFNYLADEYMFRLDDIMVTMFELVIHGEWKYTDAKGKVQKFTQATLDNLYVNRRLKQEDMDGFTGNWEPA